MDRNNSRLLVLQKKRLVKRRVKPDEPPKLVLVQWVDAVTDSGWEIGKGTSKIDLVSSIGWLLSTDDTEVVLAADVSSDKENQLHTNRRLAIPAQWIKSMKEIDHD